MDTIPQNTPLIQCTGVCQRMLPATTAFFYANPIKKSGLDSKCKPCRNAFKKPQFPQGQKRCTGPCGRLLPATLQFFYRRDGGKDGLYPKCKACVDAHNRAYRARPEIQEHTRIRQRDYYQRPEVHERIQDYSKQRKSNPEIRTHMREYSQSYFEAVHNDPEFRAKRRVIENRRRARKVNAPGSYTIQDMERIYKAQKGQCYWCHKAVRWEDRHDDHIIPLSRGGTNWPDNMCVSCKFCNISKKDRLPQEWEGSGGRLF